MIFRFNTFIVFSLLFFNVFVVQTKQKKTFKKDQYVRVLLEEVHIPSKKEIVFYSKNGFILTNLRNKNDNIKCLSSSLTVKVVGDSFYLNGKKFLKKHVLIKPIKDSIVWQGNAYQGSFLCAIQEKSLLIINSVPLEKYIFAVLRSESWPGWPLEVNKVFAVATRTYVLKKIENAQKAERLYHIKNTNIHQRYNGHTFMVRNDTVLQQAVNQTKGTYLSYKNAPITAMFDSCCGGIIPKRIDGVDFKKAPYLARPYACKHCKSCFLYNWKVEYSPRQWSDKIKSEIPALRSVKKVCSISRDKAGLVQNIRIKGRRLVSVTGKKIYSLLDDVKSFCFSIKKKCKKVIVFGRGYGHHLGLCQWGARQMVEEKWSYRKILMFYYPGTKFKKI